MHQNILRQILSATIALLLPACLADHIDPLPAAGLDVTLPDAAPDATTHRMRAIQPLTTPAAQPQMRTAEGVTYPLADPADPHAHKRNFHLAWLRVSMPAPDGTHRLSTTYVPESVPGRGYWRVLDAAKAQPADR